MHSRQGEKPREHTKKSRPDRCKKQRKRKVETRLKITDPWYHVGENDYSFDALQAYCFGINIKL